MISPPPLRMERAGVPITRMVLTGNDIRHIYRDYVLVNNTPEYLNRYVPLPLERNDKAWKWEGKAFPRVIAVMEFERLVREYTIQPKRLLVCNGPGDPEREYIQPETTIAVSYDEGSGANDLHTLDLPERDFDLVLLAQTLEHLYHPILALRQLFRHMVPGGYLFVSASVINIHHSTPLHHYMGFTPTGMGCVCRAAGFDILHIGQWGNAKYIELMFATQFWPDYRQLGDSLQNEFGNPADAWVLARRPIP